MNRKMEMDHPPLDPAVGRVLARYRDTEMTSSIESLRSAGGFSGSELWRVASCRGLFCLRRWPREHPSERRLQYIHRVLRGVFGRGVVEVATPVSDHTARTIVKEDGSLWELTPWMPGVANYHTSATPAKLAAAMQLLARFHIAAAEFSPATVGLPVGVSLRCVQLRRLLAGGFSELRHALRAAHRPSLLSQQTTVIQAPSSHGQLDSVSIVRGIDTCAQQFQDYFPILGPRILELLERVSRYRLPLQPCIRDVWHDHVLFTSEQVTGLIDFGALRDDHIASDIARLLGSLVRDDQSGWAAGIAAYEQLRPLSSVDRQLIAAYDQSGVLLSAMNWLQWLYVDGRTFDDASRVYQRCTEIAGRLSHLAK